MKIRYIIIFFHIYLLPKMLCGQNGNDSTAKFWINGGGGVINANAGVNLCVNYQKQNILYSFLATYSRHQPNPERGSIVAFSPLIGYIYRNAGIGFSASTGISLINTKSYKPVLSGNFQIFTQYKADESDSYYGVPLIAQIYLPIDTKVALNFAAERTFCRKSYNSFIFGIEIRNFCNLY